MEINKLLNNVSKNLLKDSFWSIHFLLSKTFFKNYLPLRSIYIETTSCCNLKCRGCYRTLYNYPSKNKHMSLEDFKRYVDQVPLSFSLYLHGLGEPASHPEIKEFIRYANRSRKFKNIAFTTNGLVTDLGKYSELFSEGLTQLTISVDSLDQKEVNEIRPLTDVRRLMKNIRRLLEKFPKKIKISMTINKENLYTFGRTLRKLSQIGLKEISFHPYDDFGYLPLCISLRGKEEFMERLKKLKIDNIKFYPSGFTPTEEYCKSPSTAPSINVSGYLSPCCRIYDEKVFNSGNLKDKSFKEIFFSKKYSEIQKDIEKGKYPDFCRGCNGNHIEVNCKLQCFKGN